MYPKTLALALALTSVVSASPIHKRDDPKPTSIPGGCNPAHPGSCPDSYFSTTNLYTATVSATPTSAPLYTATVIASYTAEESCEEEAPTPTPTSIPGGCNPAHPGSCPDSYFSTSVAAPVPTSIPGGCNPAHPGSCPDSYFSTTAAYPAATAAPAPGSNPVKTDKTWAVKDLSRYCGEGNTGCDYNFIIEADGKSQRCTVIRQPGKDAATESWSNQPCSGSPYTISWGYSAQPAPAFAVMTVVNGKELAWFGVSDINGQKVTTTPSNPFGSGQYPDVSAPVFTY